MNDATPLPANRDTLVEEAVPRPAMPSQEVTGPRRPLHPDTVMAAEVEDPTVSLEHFVLHLTPNCFVEMCAGFRYREREANRLYDTVSAYQARLDAFHGIALN